MAEVLMAGRKIKIYAKGRRVAAALDEITADMGLYHGVRLGQILEAVYAQGEKDGARTVFEAVEATKAKIPHRTPGRPRKRRFKGR